MCEKKEHLWLVADNRHITIQIHSLFSILCDIVIHEKHYDGLLDTGAQCNIISKNIIDELKIEHFVDKTFCPKITCENGKITKAYGIIPFLNIILDGNSTPTCFVVVDHYLSSIIIGLPFMFFYNMKLDFHSNKIYLNEKEINFKFNDKSKYVSLFHY